MKKRLFAETREIAEPLSPKEWEAEMEALAQSHKTVKWKRHNFVVGNSNQIAYNKLNTIRYHIGEVSPDIISLIPSARWLFDNFQMMYREIKKVKTTGTSYARLPILEEGEDKGFPRIYVVAREMISLTGGYLTEENISMMMKAYQKELSLFDKEVWILPEMLGLVLLKKITEVSEDIVHRIQVKWEADRFVKEKLNEKTGKLDVEPLLVPIGYNCFDDASYHSHVIYLLKNMAMDDDSIQRYAAFHCKSGHHMNPSDVFKEEGIRESLLESKIRTLIGSLREVNQMDEEKLFEELSHLEHILSQDPAGIYPQMDAESRGSYRQVIERLAQKYNLDDNVIGNTCITLSLENANDIHHGNHVGAYIVGKGLPILKAKITGHPSPKVVGDKNKKGLVYMGFVIVTLILVFGLVFTMMRTQTIAGYQWAIFAIIGTPILFGIAFDIVNRLFTKAIKVKKIPAMDYLKEIPDDARTFVVMPVIISSASQGIDYLARLRNHYLANNQNNLYFALLADYADAKSEVCESDQEITEALLAKIDKMNKLYPGEHLRFSLFIRSRKWNSSENCYMGWERKRGKLEEFNGYLTGTPKEQTSFSVVKTDESIFSTYRYVITLDADSSLVRDNAAKLVGMIDHPLNRAILDTSKMKLEAGYAIIQPTVRNHIYDKNGSVFPKIAGGQDGLVHYSSMISDIYQDVFQEGSYIGKGIYNLEVFHEILHNKIPENRVLSHDLLESCFVRTAFSGAANIMDDFPGTVLSFAKREHRWIRGDWQLLPWIFGGSEISKVSRWKMLDNLRRSIVPLCKVLFILLNLAFIPQAWYFWIPIIFFSDLLGFASLFFSIVLTKIKRPRLAIVWTKLQKDMVVMGLRMGTELMLTPYKAWNATDAIVRTIYRLAISKKNLLMWNPSDAVEKSVSNTPKGYFLHMWMTLIPSALIVVLLFLNARNDIGILIFGIVAIAWGLSFIIAYYLSKPQVIAYQPSEEELILETARRTWRFFKDFSTKENNWLCPDNYQITNKHKVTSKTSPTNIGLQFLAILSARDFGFETLSRTLEETENLLYTVVTLEKKHGHLYNWYNTKTLEILPPAYLSTVDSGNFFGHLITLKNGLIEQKEKQIVSQVFLEELENKISLAFENHETSLNYETYGSLLLSLAQIQERLTEKQAKSKEEFRITEEINYMIQSVTEEISAFGLTDQNISAAPTMLECQQKGNEFAEEMNGRIDGLCRIIDNMLEEADFQFLFGKKRNLFHIGYHVDSQTLDAGSYDLIASESLLTSFLAIARGDVPVKHWYKLSRPLTMVNGIPAFVSWSGTMFEYLMPNLVLREYEGSVFSDTYKAAVMQHIKYGERMKIPWGISESQYYRFDLDSNYQYKAFGIPELRLQPSVSNSLVVAPYATMLALEYSKEEAQINLKRMKEMGAFGDYGFYEAMDFNAPDPVSMKPYCIVKSFMAHHQGMTLVAIDNFLNSGIMRNRFHAEPIVKATEVLLEEKRQTYFVSNTKRGYTVSLKKAYTTEDDTLGRRYVSKVSPAIPAVNYMSNNQYSLMITSDGDGFSNYNGMMLYRFRADVYANTGNFIYIKDMKDNKVWSTTYHPTKKEPDDYQVIFSPHQAEFRRRDGDITTYTQVGVSITHDLEVRKVTLTNHSREEKNLEITSYMEVVGDRYLAEISHPAFNKLFVESEYLEEDGIFLSRRRSSGGEENPYIIHMVRGGSKEIEHLEYENDRLRFIGRNHTVENPDAVMKDIPLGNHAGFSNDPIMSMRARITLRAEESATISFVTGICGSKEDAVKIGHELSFLYRIDDVFEKARLQSKMELRYLNITKQQVNAFQDLISPIYYTSNHYRGPVESIRRNWKNQSFLWRFGVSGDNPIMLLRVTSIEEAGIIKDVLKAYEYLRINKIQVDLIILSEAKHGYMQEVTDLLNDMISSLKIYDEDRTKPSLFILHSYQMVPAEIDLLFTVAKIVFSEKTGVYFRDIKETLKETMED